LTTIPQKLAELTGNDAKVMKLMTSMLIKSMNEAKYVCTGTLTGDLSGGLSSGSAQLLGHAGLGLLHYTHFTSPIRRYADIIVHRLLLYVLVAEPLKFAEGLPDLYKENRSGRETCGGDASSLVLAPQSGPIQLEPAAMSAGSDAFDDELGTLLY